VDDRLEAEIHPRTEIAKSIVEAKGLTERNKLPTWKRILNCCLPHYNLRVKVEIW